MWIFTTTGFLSAVAHRDDPTLILVRARRRADLVPLAAFARLDSDAIIETPRADYRWRCTVPRETFAGFVKVQAEAVDYPNFKTACHHRAPDDHPWHTALMRVWNAMRALQNG